jgi:hypothetical protein
MESTRNAKMKDRMEVIHNGALWSLGVYCANRTPVAADVGDVDMVIFRSIDGYQTKSSKSCLRKCWHGERNQGTDILEGRNSYTISIPKPNISNSMLPVAATHALRVCGRGLNAIPAFDVERVLSKSKGTRD